MATRVAAPRSRPEVKPASAELARPRERYLKNSSDWLERNSTESKGSLPPIGPELLGQRGGV